MVRDKRTSSCLCKKHGDGQLNDTARFCHFRIQGHDIAERKYCTWQLAESKEKLTCRTTLKLEFRRKDIGEVDVS